MRIIQAAARNITQNAQILFFLNHVPGTVLSHALGFPEIPSLDLVIILYIYIYYILYIY
jgi:hypothetical protein